VKALVGADDRRAERPSAAAPLRELWGKRDLLRALVVRDLRTRYAGSSAGVFWAVVNPLVQIAILTTVFSMVLQVRFGAVAAGVPFAVVLAWGLFPWIGFQEGLVRATTALADSGVLVKRMAFPPEIVLVQPVLTATVHECVALALLVVAMPILGVGLPVTLPLCLLPLAIQVALAVGVGWILGVLHVYIRDTAQVVVAALQAWFYLTPIVYAVESAPKALRSLLSINPLAGIIVNFRAFALGEPADWGALAWSAAAAALAVAGGAFALSRARAEIADLV